VISSRQIEKALFETALNLTEPATRQAFLDQACSGDAARRARIELWLSARDAADHFFQGAAQVRAAAAGEMVAAATAAAPASGAGRAEVVLPEEGPGTRVGRYKLLERIGEGGCGVVYLAEQREPVRRRVALKVIRAGMDTESVMARFEMERQALALMDHPNIAHVLEAGATENGRPYFVMELVHGAKITGYCDENHLGVRQRLELFIQVCHAIQHAHQKGIIHRDIKPSNILVLVQDGVAVPKVIDFGIARAVEGPLTDNTMFTPCDQFVGTPAYMSPEQAEGGQDLDTRSDIYSLGVLLYELLAGRTPFDTGKLLQAGMYEMLRTLREEEPQTPSALLLGLDSAALSAAAAARDADPGRFVAALRGDLDWIVLKALAKDRRLRYETVNALAMDLQRFLNDEPVLARPPSRLYLFGKWVRRNKVVFAAGAAVALALVIGLGASTWFYFKEREALVKEREARLEQARLRNDAEMARANEATLLRQSKARENISLAAILLSQGKIQEADALLGRTSITTIEPSFEAASVFRFMGEWNGIYGRWKQSADWYGLFLKASRLDTSQKPAFLMVRLLEAAPVFLEAGDVPGYERLRDEALSRFGSTAALDVSEQLLKACLLLPAKPAMLDRLQALPCIKGRALTDKASNKPGALAEGAFAALSRAMLEYRQGHFSETIQWSLKCLSYPEANEARSAAAHALSALAAQRLGQPELARSELAQSGQLLSAPLAPDLFPRRPDPGYWFDWSIARILNREATSLIEDAPQPGGAGR
jgi:serine/threonine protein kinase